MRRGSSRTDPNGFLMELAETGDATGEYIGEFTAGAAVTMYYKCCRKKVAESA